MERGRSETEARAVAATADGSLGRRSQASAGELVEARDVAQRVLGRRRRTTIRAAGSRARRNCCEDERRARRIASSCARTCGRWRRCCATSSCSRPARTQRAGQSGRAARRSSGWRRPFGGERGARAFAAVDRALVALDRNAGVKIVADWLVLQL